MRLRAPRLSGTQRVWVLNVAMALVAFCFFWTWVRHLSALDAPLHIPWWAFAIAFFVSEVFVIHLQFRRDAHSFSLSEIPLVLALFFTSPAALLLARLVGSGLALFAYRRQSALKLAFNLGHFILEVCTATLVFRLLTSLGDPVGPAGWIGAFLSTMAADLVAALTISCAISLAEGKAQFSTLSGLLGVGLVATFTNTGVGLMSVTILWLDPRAAWLLLLAAVALFLSYRGYATVRHRHESLQFLYESTRVAQQSVDASSVIEALLRHGQEMFRAEQVEIVLFGAGDKDTATRTTLGPGGEVAVTILPPGRDVVAARVTAGGKALLAARPIEDEALRDALGARGIRDAMVAPLYGEAKIVGTMLVGNRLGDVSTFDGDDLRLFETLANHASVSVDNAQLVDRLRHKAAENQHLALHDSLTGLANRALFHTRARQAIASATNSHGSAAVMIIDIDRFKEVNDTLGHHTGDLLLQEVGSRLQGALRHQDTVARLGGDEFAVLLPGLPGASAIPQIAETVLRALERPFAMGEFSLDVGASIGIAVFPDHGNDADTLMQRADVAMYLAKEDHGGYQVYAPNRDRYTPERLALVGELRATIESGGLSVFYQPKADLRTGRVTGVEALVRWEHPQRGIVFPDEFIPLAEHTGLIRPLTFLVLEEALRQCRRWRRAGIDLSVAVNVSARSLLDLRFPDEVAELLRTWDVPPASLVLEITEGSIMADPARSIGILGRLDAMGVGLSIDDFGTGYSSLSYLRRLPVGEMKIDRSFVMGMLDNEEDAVIVRSTVDLGRNLGLRVVAEGVESRAIMDRLTSYGCDVVQGYFLSKPISPDDLIAWLGQNDGSIPVASTRPTPGVDNVASILDARLTAAHRKAAGR